MTVHSLRDRMGRLEGRLMPSRATQRQMETDAEAFTTRVLTVAAQMPAEKSAISLDEKLKMSPASHFAWAVRFAPAEADIATIMAAHGRPFTPGA